MDETARTCPWCSGRIPLDASACPDCGAAVEGTFPSDVPGLTAIDPRAPRAKLPDQMPDPVGWLRAGREKVGNRQAYALPSDEVQREIRRMAQEAEILNGDDYYPASIEDETDEIAVEASEAPDGGREDGAVAPEPAGQSRDRDGGEPSDPA